MKKGGAGQFVGWCFWTWKGSCRWENGVFRFETKWTVKMGQALTCHQQSSYYIGSVPLFSLSPIHKLFGADNNSLKISGLLRWSMTLSLPSSFPVSNVYFLFCKFQHFITFIMVGIVFVKYFILINVLIKVILILFINNI